MTTVAVPTETRPGERRAALVPESVGRLTALGVDVRVQAGAGAGANALDQAYRDAGASVVDGDVMAGAEVVLTVNSLDVDRVSALARGTIVVSFLAPVQSLDKVKAAQQAGVTWLSMELVPRLTLYHRE